MCEPARPQVLAIGCEAFSPAATGQSWSTVTRRLFTTTNSFFALSDFDLFVSTVDEAGIHDLERRAAHLDTAFGRRLRVLLDSHGDIPVVFGGFSLPAWLCMLAEEDGDAGAAAANL
jgi:hypothetical protein